MWHKQNVYIIKKKNKFCSLGKQQQNEKKKKASNLWTIMRSFHRHFLLCIVSKYHRFFLAKKTKRERKHTHTQKWCSVKQSAQIGEKKMREKLLPKKLKKIIKVLKNLLISIQSKIKIKQMKQTVKKPRSGISRISQHAEGYNDQHQTKNSPSRCRRAELFLSPTTTEYSATSPWSTSLMMSVWLRPSCSMICLLLGVRGWLSLSQVTVTSSLFTWHWK